MDINLKCLYFFLSLARFFGILPFTATVAAGNTYFQSVLTPMYIFKGLFAATVVLIFHIKFRVYDKINAKASFKMAVYVGCSTATLTFAIAIVLVSTTIYGKSVTKLTVFFPKRLALKDFANKRFLSELFVFFAQIVYLAVVIIGMIVLNVLEHRSWLLFVANLCIDLYTELVTHAWTFAYFNLLLKLRIAFKDLYSSSLQDDFDVVALNECWSRYLYLRSVVIKTNRIQGLNAIFCVGFIYVWQLYNLYAFLGELMKNELDKIVATSLMIRVVVQGVKLFVLIYQAPKATNWVQKFRIRLGHYRGEDNHIEEVSCLLFVVVEA